MNSIRVTSLNAKTKEMIKILASIFCLLYLCGCQQPQLKEVSGTLRIGHEVRSFTDIQDKKEYWIIDKSGTLIKEYQKTIGTNIVNNQPVRAVLKVENIGKIDEGSGAEYDGTYEVKKIISLQKLAPSPQK